jgi:hypothetical protein
MPGPLQLVHDFLFYIELLVLLFVLLAAAVSMLQERRQRVDDRVPDATGTVWHSAWTVREEEVEAETKAEEAPVNGGLPN